MKLFGIKRNDPFSEVMVETVSEKTDLVVPLQDPEYASLQILGKRFFTRGVHHVCCGQRRLAQGLWLCTMRTRLKHCGLALPHAPKPAGSLPDILAFSALAF